MKRNGGKCLRNAATSFITKHCQNCRMPIANRAQWCTHSAINCFRLRWVGLQPEGELDFDQNDVCHNSYWIFLEFQQGHRYLHDICICRISFLPWSILGFELQHHVFGAAIRRPNTAAMFGHLFGAWIAWIRTGGRPICQINIPVSLSGGDDSLDATGRRAIVWWRWCQRYRWNWSRKSTAQSSITFIIQVINIRTSTDASNALNGFIHRSIWSIQIQSLRFSQLQCHSHHYHFLNQLSNSLFTNLHVSRSR